MTALGILWFVLIAVLLAVYYVLDGFDLGAAVLSPIVAKTEQERRALVRAIGPVWDGNEVWLLTAGGALFAAFAPAYASAFSGFYLAIMLVLFGLVVRAVAIEFSAHDEALRGLWNALFVVGSLLPALLFGVALGNCLQGVPLDANGDYTGGLLGLLGPFPLLCGLLGLSTVLLQGAAWLSLKIERGSALQQRARHARLVLQIATVLLFVAVAAFFLLERGFQLNEGAALVAQVAALVAIVVGIVAGFLAGGRGSDLFPFLAASLVCVGLVALFTASMFPNFIVSTGTGPSISIANAQASTLTLTVMSMVACVGVPLVAAYHIVVYRAFSGRIAIGR